MLTPLTFGRIKQINIPRDATFISECFGNGFTGQLIRVPELMHARIVEYYRFFLCGNFTVTREHLNPDNADVDFCLQKFFDN
jgi:hypothetical protein